MSLTANVYVYSTVLRLEFTLSSHCNNWGSRYYANCSGSLENIHVCLSGNYKLGSALV